METWLKICKSTLFKPKLQLIANRLNCSRGDVFFYCVKLWAWADSQTSDGFIPNLSTEDVASLADIPINFCRALAAEDVAWLTMRQNTKTGKSGVLLHDWQKHNGKCAKKRADDARRQATSRWKRKNSKT